MADVTLTKVESEEGSSEQDEHEPGGEDPIWDEAQSRRPHKAVIKARRLAAVQAAKTPRLTTPLGSPGLVGGAWTQLLGAPLPITCRIKGTPRSVDSDVGDEESQAETSVGDQKENPDKETPATTGLDNPEEIIAAVDGGAAARW